MGLQLSKAAVLIIPLLLVAAPLASYVGLKFRARYQIDTECCQLPLSRSLVVNTKEKLGLVTFYSQMHQDKWVSEEVFPDVKNGFFLECAMRKLNTRSFNKQRGGSMTA